MKKFILMSVLCALALTGCKDDSEPDFTIIPDADYTGLVLNEVCGGDVDSKDDWIEIYNTSGNTINLEGVQLVKTDESGVSATIYTFAKGTTIAAKAYQVRGKDDLSASISNSKSVIITLQAPSGKEIDKFNKDAEFGENGSHEIGGSYARIPDGTGDWTIMVKATKGMANSDDEPEVPSDMDYTGLILNEICGGDADENDWIEIYNNSNNPINLNGIKLVKTDEKGKTETLCTFAEGTIITSKAYLVKVKDVDFTQGISNTKAVIITMQSPSGDKIDEFNRDVEVGEGKGHELGGSYSRVPNITGGWAIVAQATKGVANVTTDQPEEPSDKVYTGLVLNELNGNDPKYIEIYNYSDTELDITGVQIKKDDGEIVYVAPEGTKIGSHAFLVLLSDQADYTTGFTSGLSSKKTVKIELLSPDGGTSLDVFKNLKDDGTEIWGDKNPKYNGENAGMAYARKTDGTGKWYLMKPTQGVNNTGTSELGEEIIW